MKQVVTARSAIDSAQRCEFGRPTVDYRKEPVERLRPVRGEIGRGFRADNGFITQSGFHNIYSETTRKFLDLWGFNEEIVARAIARVPVPILIAILVHLPIRVRGRARTLW